MNFLLLRFFFVTAVSFAPYPDMPLSLSLSCGGPCPPIELLQEFSPAAPLGSWAHPVLGRGIGAPEAQTSLPFLLRDSHFLEGTHLPLRITGVYHWKTAWGPSSSTDKSLHYVAMG